MPNITHTYMSANSYNMFYHYTNWYRSVNYAKNLRKIIFRMLVHMKCNLWSFQPNTFLGQVNNDQCCKKSSDLKLHTWHTCYLILLYYNKTWQDKKTLCYELSKKKLFDLWYHKFCLWFCFSFHSFLLVVCLPALYFQKAVLWL